MSRKGYCRLAVLSFRMDDAMISSSSALKRKDDAELFSGFIHLTHDLKRLAVRHLRAFDSSAISVFPEPFCRKAVIF